MALVVEANRVWLRGGVGFVISPQLVGVVIFDCVDEFVQEVEDFAGGFIGDFRRIDEQEGWWIYRVFFHGVIKPVCGRWLLGLRTLRGRVFHPVG